MLITACVFITLLGLEWILAIRARDTIKLELIKISDKLVATKLSNQHLSDALNIRRRDADAYIKNIFDLRGMLATMEQDRDKYKTATLQAQELLREEHDVHIKEEIVQDDMIAILLAELMVRK